MAHGGDSILSDTGTLSSHGFTVGRGTITLSCAKKDHEAEVAKHSVEFAIQVSKREAATAWTVGLLVDYAVGHHTGHLLVPATYALCGNGPGPPSNAGLCRTAP
jgi:hypothetical protein